MQLYGTPDNPCPPDADVRDVLTPDGLHLRAALWPAQTASACGTIVICQGRSEYIEKYFEVIGEFLKRGFCVLAFDWRGQGGSQRLLPNPRKGHIDEFDAYWQDIAAMERECLPQCPKPHYALGHSMGGAILLDMAGNGRAPFARMVLSAPMIDIYGIRFPKLSRWLIAALDALGLGGAYAPGGGSTASNTAPFAGNVLTGDAARYARNAATLAQAPQLGLGHCTIGWLNAAFRLIARLAEPDFPRRTVMPILVLGAGSDRVVDLRATEAFAHRLKAGKLITLPQAEHEVLMERDNIRALCWAAIDAFLPPHPSKPEGSQP